MRAIGLIAALLSFTCVVDVAYADPLAFANRLRARDCGTRTAAPPLKHDPHIAAVAQRWSQGGRLERSIPRSYGGAEFVSLRVSGVRNDEMLTSALRAQFCDSLTQPKFTRFGFHRERDEYWIVLASTASTLPSGDASAVRTEVLRLVNETRRTQRRCGMRSYNPVPPLELNTQLNRAAETHARGMARHQKLQHEGFDGSTPGERATAAGYAWRAIAENIAAGPTTASEVVQMWLDSPGHCANIMSPSYTELGLAFAEDRETQSGVYWAQEFGRSR